MKKILLIVTTLFTSFSLPAQITQEKADSVVLERLSQETHYIIYAKEGIQTNMTITTANEEMLELNYNCWVYYISYTDVNCCLGRYLIVNASNGNLLEVKTTSNATSEDLVEWREVTDETEYPIEIPFIELINRWSYGGSGDNNLYVINSDEELKNCTSCPNVGIDFSQETLLLASGNSPTGVRYIDIKFFKNTANEYALNVTVHRNMADTPSSWLISIIVPKIDHEATVTLNVQQTPY